MDKLKSVFSPGSNKDDELMYGDAAARRASATEAEPQSAPEQLHPVEGSDKKEHGILRQILNPSGEKYDDQAYGTTASTQPPEVEPGKLQTDPEAHKKDHTIVRQILNPNNAKYDEQRFGETAATSGDRKNSVPATEVPSLVGADTKLETDPGRKDSSILRQILNPHGDKYDQQGYGTTAHAVGEGDQAALRSDPVSNPDSSITRQILNPGQEKYDPVVHGSSQPTAGAAATSSTVPSQGIGSNDTTLPDRTTAAGRDSNLGRDAALATGGAGATSAGAYAAHHHNDGSNQAPQPPTTTTNTTTTTTTTSSQPLNNRSTISSQPASSQVPSTEQTHYGRDATLAGGGLAVAGGAGYYAATRDDPNEKITDRAHPLGGTTGESNVTSVPASSQTTSQIEPTSTETTSSAPHSVGPAGGAHINPVGAPEESLISGGSRIERDALTGAGAVGTTGAGAPTQINSAPSDVQDATYTDRAYPVGAGIHHTTGPHQTDIANILDPHVPGEFPAADGTDKHGLSNPPLGPALASDSFTTQPGTTATDATEPDSKTIIGTIASAVGLGGLVGATSSKDQANKAVDSTQPTSTATHSDTTSHPIQTTTNSLSSAPVSAQGTDGISTGETGEKTTDHHYGRDAGIVAGAAGAGAAGYGLHEAIKDRDTAAPASGTVGQTTSQPVPTTTTNTAANTTSRTAAPTEPSTTAASNSKRDDHHYGRDAAVAGGAGAAGYGIYDATKGRDDTGPASKTIGPHDSNVANIVDPRVQPEPEKMKESKTVGPHSSDIANKVDPRVTSDPAQAHEDNRSRDAALVGGAGAAGAGAVAASRYEDARQPPNTATTTTTIQEPTTHTSGEPGYDHKDSKKLQKTREDHADEMEDKGEKKHGLLHKILHPGRKDKDKDEKEEKEGRKSVEDRKSVEHPPGSLNHPLVTSEDIDNRISTDEKGHNKLHKKAVEQPRVHDPATTTATTGAHQSSHIGTDGPIGRDNEVSGQIDPTFDRKDETVIEPHTGLPMNIGKYGPGTGGTDAAPQIAGYHETDPAIRSASIGTAQNAGTKEPSHQPGEEGVAGPDWNAIKKANTPY